MPFPGEAGGVKRGGWGEKRRVGRKAPSGAKAAENQNRCGNPMAESTASAQNTTAR